MPFFSHCHFAKNVPNAIYDSAGKIFPYCEKIYCLLAWSEGECGNERKATARGRRYGDLSFGLWGCGWDETLFETSDTMGAPLHTPLAHVYIYIYL